MERALQGWLGTASQGRRFGCHIPKATWPECLAAQYIAIFLPPRPLHRIALIRLGCSITASMDSPMDVFMILGKKCST